MQPQLQRHYTNYTTPQLQLRYATTATTAAVHHTTSSSCGWGDQPGDHCNHCNHSKKHNSNHLSVHQWIRSAIRDSQHADLTSERLTSRLELDAMYDFSYFSQPHAAWSSEKIWT